MMLDGYLVVNNLDFRQTEIGLLLVAPFGDKMNGAIIN